MSNREIKNYTDNMLKSDFDLICGELLPKDKDLFIEKYINGKTNKELKVSQKTINNLNTKLVKIITIIKKSSLIGISETLLRYRCKKLGLDRDKIEFAVDCFVNDMTRKELAKKYLYEEETIKKYKSKLKKELERLF